MSSELTLITFSIMTTTTRSTAAATYERTILKPAGTHTPNGSHAGQDRSRVSTFDALDKHIAEQHKLTEEFGGMKVEHGGVHSHCY